MNTIKWVVPHPGTGKWIEVDSFEQAMDQWFEGFNLPVLVTDGKAEDFHTSYNRVKTFLNKRNE